MQIADLDDIDNRIIDLLLKNGRASYSEIGAAVGLSRTAAKNRIRALEASGIIRGYQAILDPQASTGGMTFVVNIETEASQFAAIKDAMTAAPETLTLMQTTGSCHLLALCYVPSVADMRLFVRALYQRTPGILSISAHSVLDLIKGFIAPGISNFEVYEHDSTAAAQRSDTDR